MSSNVISDSNGETNFPHKLLLTNREFSKFCKVFGNNSSANIKFSNSQLSKIKKSWGFLGRLLGPLSKIGLPLMKNALKSLTKKALIPLLTTPTLATDAAIQKKFMALNHKIDNFKRRIERYHENSYIFWGICFIDGRS